jgi:hypothetical protein
VPTQTCCAGCPWVALVGCMSLRWTHLRDRLSGRSRWVGSCFGSCGLFRHDGSSSRLRQQRRGQVGLSLQWQQGGWLVPGFRYWYCCCCNVQVTGSWMTKIEALLRALLKPHTLQYCCCCCCTADAAAAAAAVQQVTGSWMTTNEALLMLMLKPHPVMLLYCCCCTAMYCAGHWLLDDQD